MTRSSQPSPLALAILAFLYDEPMHPYRMQQLIKEWGKDEVVNVRQRTSIYQTIDRLLRTGLIRVRATTRDEKRPERTVYELTDEGRQTMGAWLREMLATPSREYPDFPAAIAFLMLLTPEDALRQLETRAAALETEAARLDALLRMTDEMGLPRLFVLETELMRAILDAELRWVRSIIDDLRTGEITWNETWLREIATRMGYGRTENT